jgi:hypothetical protein
MKTMKFTEEEKRLLLKIHKISNLETRRSWMDTNEKEWFGEMRKELSAFTNLVILNLPELLSIRECSLILAAIEGKIESMKEYKFGAILSNSKRFWLKLIKEYQALYLKVGGLKWTQRNTMKK